MSDSQTARPSMLARLADAQDGEAWTQLVEIYSPLVYRYLRRRGLQDSDAADVGQEVLRTVSRSVGGFEHRRPGSFRRWLITIAQSRLADFVAQQQKQVAGSGDTAALDALDRQPAPDDEEELIEQEYRKCLFE